MNHARLKRKESKHAPVAQETSWKIKKKKINSGPSTRLFIRTSNFRLSLGSVHKLFLFPEISKQWISYPKH